jgi:uncharacterized membrane protein HdeD (DUF308 family)
MTTPAAGPIVDVDTLARNWWMFLVRGLLGMLFGVLTFLQPGISLAALVLLFGAYSFADGIFAVVSAMRRRTGAGPWWLILIEGLAGIGVGVMTLLWPGVTAVVLLWLIAAWAIVTGVFEIGAAIRLRKVIAHEWLLALSGVASIALGVLLALFPGPGALALVLWIGAAAFVWGLIFAVLSFRLRSWGRTHPSHPGHAAPMPA